MPNNDKPRYLQFKHADEPVEDIWDLLWYCAGDHGWKASKGTLKKPLGRRDTWTVEKSYDQNYYFSADWRNVPEEIATEAIRKGYFIGKPEWGYRSESQFVVSEQGERVLWDKIRDDREAAEAKNPPKPDYDLPEDNFPDY